MTWPTDDLGTPLRLRPPPRRVVSLVPSLTESIARTAPQLLVGRTDWCTEPSGLSVPRVGGTKWPDLDRVLALAPDLVVANAEENRPGDIAEIRAAGVAVWVTAPSTVDAALRSLSAMFGALATPTPAWLETAKGVWRADPELDGLRAAAFIWRKPWMVVGRDTFAGDVLRRLGLINVFADHEQRYPQLTPAEVAALDVDLVVLPDEPYRFTLEDGPGHFPGRRSALVSGRHLTWYGPSMVEAPAVLSAALRRPDLAV